MEEGSAAARKVMVVADPSRESAGALQYALSHAVMENDTLILLHVESSNPWKNPLGALFKNPMSPGPARLGGIGSYSASSAAVEGGGGGEVDFLDGMKRSCMAAKPKMKVVLEKVEMPEGKDKASLIVAHSAACKVDLLIIGQKRTTLISKSILGSKRGLSFKGYFETADYAIENSKCTCVAVQKKGNGGYLLNSKSHKNFWLLA